MPNALIRSFFDPATSTVTHAIADAAAGRAAVIDPVLDYDPKTGRTSTTNADALIEWVRAEGLAIDWLLETHAHADHLSAAPYLQRQLGGRIAIGAHIREVQRAFKPLFNAADMATDGSPFEQLFADGERFRIGALEVEVMHTPGHTPGCVSYALRSDAGLDVFIGDTLFMPDYGSARCDFPGGDAATLYRSIRRLLARLPGQRARAALGQQRRRAAPRQRSCARRHHRSRVHRDAHGARPHPCEAGAAAARDPGQRARRPVAAGRSQRRALPEDSAERDVTRCEQAQARPVSAYCHTTRWCLPTQRSNIGP
jgi:glyoxylase-like metal-dependent hydrolase (beta-lactamase superfamily II)